MRFGEIIAQAVDHGVADLIKRIHVLLGVFVALGKREAGVMKSVPAAVAARQRYRRGLADMADAERVDETLERDLPTHRDRGK